MDIREALDRLICVIFPPRCFSCDTVVCYEDLLCERCGYEHADFESCRSKLRDVPVSGVIAGTLFSGGIKKAVYTIKDRPDVRVKNFFADTMLGEINENWTSFALDYAIPVPLSPEKLRQRGFNQAGMLAKELAERLHIPYADNVLTKDNGAQMQRMLNIRQREENAKKSFHIAVPEIVKGRSVLLVDDVLTTGATLRVCASLLLNNGAKSVYIAVASSTPGFASATDGSEQNSDDPLPEK